MPTNVVRTPRQEHLWDKAKAQAEKEGKSKDWAYIMGIFKHMGGLDKTAGFIGNVLGKNVGEAKGAVNALKENMGRTKETVNRLNKNKGFFGKYIGNRQGRKLMKEDYKELRNLKNKVKDEQSRTFKARAIGAGAVGAGGGAAYMGNKLMENRNTGNNDEFKPQYLASEKEELIEKVAIDIIKEASIGSRARSIWDSLRDTANRSRLDAARLDFNAVRTGVRNPNSGRTAGEMIDLKKNIDRLENRNKRLATLRDRYNPVDKERTGRGGTKYNPFNDEFVRANRGRTADRMNDARNRSQHAKRYADVIAENNKLIDVANQKYTRGYKDIQDVHDKELQKVLGLYGGIAGATGLAGHRILKHIKKKNADKKT